MINFILTYLAQHHFKLAKLTQTNKNHICFLLFLGCQYSITRRIFPSDLNKTENIFGIIFCRSVRNVNVRFLFKVQNKRIYSVSGIVLDKTFLKCFMIEESLSFCSQ